MESLEAGRIVTAVRDGLEVEQIDGFVVSIADDWVVMHDLVDGVYLDGIVMLRLDEISRVRFRDDDAYHHRAIAGLGEAVSAFDCDGDVRTSDLIAAASARADIFAVHFENLRGEPLLIGRLLRRRKKSFEMHYVGRDGVWAREKERWAYKDVTRIEVGGRYLDALNRFADPFPSAG